MADLKPGEFLRGRLHVGSFIANVAEKSVADFSQKRVQLARLAFGDEFDAAIGEVSDVATHLVAARNRVSRVSKPDALHPARILHRAALSPVGVHALLTCDAIRDPAFQVYRRHAGAASLDRPALFLYRRPTMKCCVQLFAAAGVWFLLAPPPHHRATAAAETPSTTVRTVEAAPTVVVLNDGGVLTGRVSRIEDGYMIRRGGTEIQVPAANVLVACRSLEEAYEVRRRQVAGPAADSHLALAAWCLRYGLQRQAARELVVARGLEPGHPRLALLQRRLAATKLSAAETPTPPAADESVAAAAGDAGEVPALPATEDVSGAAVERFTRKVQPILVNNCTTSGCHHRGGRQQFQLDRALLHGLSNRRTTMHNLSAALALVNREQPQLSPLLTIPRQAHGGMRAPIFGPRQAAVFNYLVDWVALITSDDSANPELLPTVERLNLKAATDNSAQGPVVLNGADAIEAAPLENTARLQGPATDKPRIQFGARLKPWRPKDAFDPEIFNRQSRRQSPGESSETLEKSEISTGHR
jgi:hypothetical protein